MTRPRISTTEELRANWDQLNKNILNYGYYEGFRRNTVEFDMPKNVCQKLEAGMFKHLISKIQEGQREVPKLQAALARLETTCRSGSDPARLSGNGPTISVWGELGTTMQAVDGWSISILETSITLLMAIQNPKTGAHRITSLRDTFSNLWEIRALNYGPLESHPELFDMRNFSA